ncbi:MAG: TRAP transporter TatT component family protein, partial [Vicinamibacterales bacterium]
ESLERVLALDASFMNGSADRALGRWYHKVPGLFGGSRKRAEAHLRASLRYDPESVLTHFFLGELFLDDGRKADAREAFETAISAPINPEWAPEDEDYKRQARERLARLD